MDDTARNPRAMSGSNTALPPTDLEALKEWLHDVHADIAEEKANVLLDLAKLPATIASEEDRHRVIDALARAARLAKRIESARETAKAPFLSAGASVDGYFKTELSKPLAEPRTQAQDELTRYQNAEAARVRDEARRREEAARAEAERKEKEARKLERKRDPAPTPETEARPAALRNEAQAAGARAEGARVIATAKAADLTRTRSASGALSTTVTNWDFEVTDPAQVHPRFKVVEPKLIRAAKNEQVRLGTIETYREPGIRFFKIETSQVRG